MWKPDPRLAAKHGRLAIAVLADLADLKRDSVGQALAASSFQSALVQSEKRSPMPDVEIHIDLDGATRPIGLLRRRAA
jgi:hypothetical protein